MLWYLVCLSSTFPPVNIRSAASHLSVARLIRLSGGWSRDPSLRQPITCCGHSALMPLHQFPPNTFCTFPDTNQPLSDISPAFNRINQNDNRHKPKFVKLKGMRSKGPYCMVREYIYKRGPHARP